MDQKSKSKLLKTIIETVQSCLKPAILAISEKLDGNSEQMGRIEVQLERIEHKIDLLLSSKGINSGLNIPKKKIFHS